jgi:DNA-directed RNA polymerase II subunit RPB2
MDTDISDEIIWKMIDVYFRDNPQGLVRHHIDSYNDFLDYDLSSIFKETNPLKLDLEYDAKKNIFLSSANIYLAGISGKRIFYGKPIIYDSKDNIHYMLPNEARLRNMTYALPIYVDLDIEITRYLSNLEDATPVDEQGYKIVLSSEDKTPNKMRELVANIRATLSDNNMQTFKMRPIRKFICKLPIMVQSKYCILYGLPRDARYSLGECKNDLGAYFIIDGKEKTVVSQEKFGDNMLYIKKSEQKTVNDQDYLYSAEIRSVSENVAKPVRTLSVRMVAPNTKYTNLNIVVNIPNVRKPVPLFILFRALGIISDREIISMCLLKDPSDPSVTESTIDWFLPSIHDAGIIQSQQDALEYLSLLIKGRTIPRVLHILADYFLPHIGEINYLEKAYYLGHMVQKLFFISNGIEPPTDRDNYKYKRVELIGSLLKDLFREYYMKFQSRIRLGFESKYEFNKQIYSDISSLIDETHNYAFEKNIVEEGIRKAFKGNWGAEPHTKRIGAVQDLNRLSFNGMMCHLRKTNLPLDPSVKLVGPRILHSSQWGIIDPIDTPDGGNIGIHKYLAILTYVTRNHSREPILQWMRKHTELVLLTESYPSQLGQMTKVFVNGYWSGCIAEPMEMVQKMRECRRQSLIPISNSIAFDIPKNSVFIYTDGGRLCRPIFYKDEHSKKFPFQNISEWKSFTTHLLQNTTSTSSDVSHYSWTNIVSGFHSKKDPDFDPMKEKIYEWEELYSVPVDSFREKKAILDYIDSNESECAFIALDTDLVSKNPHYTHREIHSSTLYGIMCNQIDYLEHNPVTRNSFSCGQSKQACSLYHTNYTLRMDKTAVILNYGQIPLIKSQYMKYINNEENPYGENAIVAIMCFTGYNVEDAILVNEGALQRGLFRTTYYSTYEAHEEREQKGDTVFTKTFSNIESLIRENGIVGIKPEYDYSYLDEHGLIKENIEVNDKMILIGISSTSSMGSRKDESKTTKKGQVGKVDKSFMTDGEIGERIAKVRLREERIPAMGDKMASRAGQKGTIGMIIPEADMPFTRDGLKPDLIINPHALPSRMTIGQIVECLSAKACAHYGSFGDCTPFVNLKQNMVAFFGNLLRKMGSSKDNLESALRQSGFHSSGNEIFYDGMSGSQMEAEIFVGPTYYMRLKHMVKDKINYRARGPMTNLTRQPVSGRANDGGLRIGEMERDAVLSHGTALFLNESMLQRGDLYYMAVCNKTGMIAVYNPNKNIFYSPMADGPIKYTGSLVDGTTQVHQLTRFGRDFSIVAVPYSFKLLMQELLAMNIRMSIITDDNISQIENMGFSDSIERLMFLPNAVPKNVIDHTNEMLESSVINIPSPHSPKEPPLPKYEARTPVYTPPEEESSERPPSPEWLPPNYKPPTEEFSERPPSPEWLPPNYKPPTEESSPMQVGGKVHYRGDNNPARLWTIQHAGSSHYTIDTEDMDGISTEDSIRIVKPEDIYSPNDSYLYSIPTAMAEIPTANVNANANVNATEPKLHFAPVIKIFNHGNDMSQDTSSTPEMSFPSNENNATEYINGFPTTEESFQGGDDTNAIDFSKPMIIKKM